MKEVGAFEAKTHLSELLEQVSQGEEILITRRGKPVARLVPANHLESSRTSAVFDRLKALRVGVRLDGLDWKQLRDEGRR